ncbi:MAG: type II toxin-antitoxin system VapC family toxin [Acidimicrobiia bacterium]
MVSLAYLDTSAAMKLVVSEAESEALVEHLMSHDRLASSWLLHTELYCAAGRHPSFVKTSIIGEVLDAVHLVDLTRGDMISAGSHAPLRSHDAIHLSVAMRLAVDEILTYDQELSSAARAVGLAVSAPS